MRLPLAKLLELLSQLDQSEPLCVEWQGVRYEVVDALVWDSKIANIKIKKVTGNEKPDST